MKIEKVIITNFKSISLKIVDFEKDKISALVGFNGTGKSSFLEAIRYGLTGVLPLNPIMDKKDFASVEIVADDGTFFSRTVYRENKPGKVTLNGKTTPAKNLNAWISEKFGFDTDVLKIATSADVLAAMKSDELGNFLLQYIPEKLSTTKIFGYLTSPTPEMQEEVLLALPDTDFEITDLENVYAAFMENRKNQKKELEFIKAKYDKLPTVEPSRSLDVIQAAYEDICAKEGAEKGTIEAVRLYESILEKRKVAQTNLDALQKRFDGILASRPNPLIKQDLENKMADARNQISKAQSTIEIMNKTINTLNETLARLSTDFCPLSELIVCTTDKTHAKNEILLAIQSNEEGVKIQNEIIAEKKAALFSFESSLKEYNDNESMYKEKCFIGEQIERTKKTIPEIPSKPTTIASSVDFTKEKAILKEELKYAKDWEDRIALEKVIERKTKNVATLDSLCKSFAPKGEVMTRILQSYITLFEEEINKTAIATRKDMKVKFVSENGIKYYVKMKSDKDFRYYEELSKGEKILSIFLLLDLVSALCGTRILLLDDLNHLDALALEDIFSIITNPSFMEEYDHVIISAVNSQDVINVTDKHAAVIQKI